MPLRGISAHQSLPESWRCTWWPSGRRWYICVMLSAVTRDWRRTAFSSAIFSPSLTLSRIWLVSCRHPDRIRSARLPLRSSHSLIPGPSIRRCRISLCASGGGRRWPSWGPTAQARPPSSSCCAGCMTRMRGVSWSTAAKPPPLTRLLTGGSFQLCSRISCSIT